MKAQQGVLFVCLVLALTGCAGLAVDTDYDPAFDFSNLKTFDWSPTQPDAAIDDLVEKRVRVAVNNELQARGYVLSSEAPDFLISMLVTSQTSTAGSVGVGASVGIPVGRGTVSVGGGKSEPRVKKEGTLVLDFQDARSRSLIWKGTASAAIKGSSSPEDQQARITRVVTEILAEFPPGHK
jgi:hypothetical protein